MTLNRRVLRRVHSPLRSPCRSNTSLRKKALIRQISGEVQFGASSKANLKVVVRVRPFNQRELENNAKCVVDVVDEHMLIFDPRRENDDFFFKGARQRTRDLNKKPNREQKFAFERVFSYDSTNEQLYEASTSDLLDTLLAGYNCSVFAYGATGAGKTFTMLGTETCPGITFLTLMELYKRIEVLKEKTFEVAVSYLEVYNETVRDLLKPGKALSLQEVGQQVMVPGLSLHKPADAKELMQMLAQGNQNRTQHPTDANSESSRSHAVFQVFVKQQDRLASGPKTNVAISKLSMIDLAGSERGGATGFKGARFREGASINKSLLALGNCINALADGQRHIPYRDSKLTRLLKDSLGGNCRSVMIAAISPASTTFEDTFNTLRYANRAKTIKTTIKKNLLNVDQHVSNYVKIVADLREEVVSLNAKIKKHEAKEAEWEKERASLLANQTPLTPTPEATSELSSKEREDYEAKIAELEARLKKKNTPEESNEAQRLLEEASREVRTLRCELMRLENNERVLEFKIHAVTARLQRMEVISFASQKLDKSIARCKNSLRNLDKSRNNIANQKQNIKAKLEPSMTRLANLCDHPEAPLPPHLTDKLQANAEVREYHQHWKYMSRLLEKEFKEQSRSEHLITQLLHATRQFYVQLRADNQCTPTFSQIFLNVVDNLDESKIVWADQQPDGEGDGNQGNNSAETLRPLDAAYFSQLPFPSTINISPVVPIAQPRPRKSNLKSNDTAEIPQLPSRCLASASDVISSPVSVCSPVAEDDEVFRKSDASSSQPKHPSSPVSSHSFKEPEQTENRKSPPLPVVTTQAIPPASPAINSFSISSYQQETKAKAVGFVSLSQSGLTVPTTTTTTEVMNTTEVLEDIEPVDCSMNATFSVTPGKLNTTIDMPSSSSSTSIKPVDVNIVTISSLSTFPTKKPEISTSTAPGINETFSEVRSSTAPTVKSETISSTAGLNQTFSEVKPSGQIPLTTSVTSVTQVTQSTGMLGNGINAPYSITTKGSSDQSKTSRKLFLPSLDSTFCVGNNSELIELPQTPSPPVTTVTAPTSPEKDGKKDDPQRSPLQQLTNKTEKPAVPVPTSTTEVSVSRTKPKTLRPGFSITPHKLAISKSSITPHKVSSTTPGKASLGRTISVSNLLRGGNGAMKRSISSPSLAAVSSTKKHSLSSKKKLGGLGGIIHRTSGILHPRPGNTNQENVPPGAARKSTHSSIFRETVSSAAKHTGGLGKP